MNISTAACVFGIIFYAVAVAFVVSAVPRPHRDDSSAKKTYKITIGLTIALGVALSALMVLLFKTA